jgi:hypothetical protein
LLLSAVYRGARRLLIPRDISRPAREKSGDLLAVDAPARWRRDRASLTR